MRILTGLLSSIVLVTTVSCTVKGKPYHEHEEDNRPLQGQPEITARPESISASTEAGHWEESYKTSQDPLKAVLLPLADRVLDPKRIQDKRSIIERSVMDELMMFNRLLLNLPKEQRARPEFKDLLKRYSAALQTQCEEFMDSCIGFHYFQISANSEQVAKLIAENDPDNYFKMLLYAIKLKNAYWDSELASMIFANPVKNLSQTEAKRRDTARSLMETALQTARDKSRTPEQQRSFLDSVHGWDLMTGEAQNFDASTQSALYEMIAGSKYMYAADGKGLQPDFKKIVDTVRAQPDGFFAAQRKLHDQKLFSAESIGAKFVQKFDEVFWIIDSVFNGKLAPESAALLFASTGRSAKELESDLQNYMRIRFLLALNETSQFAKTIFDATVQGQDLLFHFIRESASVASIWNTFTSRSLPVKNFGVLAAHRLGATTIENQIKSLFDSIQNSINVSSAYPHQMILFHMLSQKRFQLVIPFSGRKYDTGDIIRLLYDGKLEPLLQYSTNKFAFNQYQLIYAFDMAVRTNLFKIVNIDPDFFISDTLRRLNGTATDAVSTTLSAIQNRFNQSLTYQQFKAACGEFKGKPVQREFYFMELERSPYYGQMLDDAFTDVSDLSNSSTAEPGSLPKYVMGIYYMDRTYDEMIEKARVDMGRALRIGHGMLESYTASLREAGLNSAQIEAKTELTRKALAEMDNARAKVLTTAKAWQDDIGDCYWKAFAKDNEVQMQVLNYERAYLRQVFRDIKKLRAGASDTEKATIQSHIQFSGLPSNFKGQDRISSDGYVYSEIDFKIRVAKYLMNGLTTEDGTLPPLAPGLRLNFGNRLDIEVNFVRDSIQKSIAFIDDIDVFTNSAMAGAINGTNMGHRDAFVTWVTSPSGHIITWSDYMKTLVSLYRLEHEVRGENKDFTGQAILSAQQQVLGLTQFSKEERQAYSLIYAIQKYPALYFDHRLLIYDIEKERIQDTWGLFDFPIKLMDEEALGANYDADQIGLSNQVPPRAGAFTAGQMYYTTRANENRGTTVIPYNSQLDKALDSEMTRFVRGELDAQSAFHNLTLSYTSALEQKPEDQRPRADITVYMSIRTLLTDSLVSGYKSKKKLFNMTTDSCFTSDSTCSSFQQNPDSI